MCQDYLTDKDCPNEISVLTLILGKQESVLDVVCRRPARDSRHKGSPPQQSKGQGRGRGKAKPKPKAQAQVSVNATGANAVWALDEDDLHHEGAGEGDDELNYVTSASVCSFCTTLLPTFHAASTQNPATEDHPENLPILDTCATHCLLPLSWLGAEECEMATWIRLKATIGTTVRVLHCTM